MMPTNLSGSKNFNNTQEINISKIIPTKKVKNRNELSLSKNISSISCSGKSEKEANAAIERYKVAVQTSKGRNR